MSQDAVSGAWEGVVKVQLPLSGDDQALIYPEDRSWSALVKVTPDIASIMNGRVKAFFLVRKGSEGVEVVDEAPWQNW